MDMRLCSGVRKWFGDRERYLKANAGPEVQREDSSPSSANECDFGYAYYNGQLKAL